MTGVEHSIEQAAEAIDVAMRSWEYRWLDDPDDAPAVIARALAEAGLLAPAPLREEWAAIDDDGDVRMRYGADSHSSHREYGTSWTYSRWVSDWKPYDAEGDGKAEQ